MSQGKLWGFFVHDSDIWVEAAVVSWAGGAGSVCGRGACVGEAGASGAGGGVSISMCGTGVSALWVVKVMPMPSLVIVP